MKRRSGLFISFEGPDGAGKSTQKALLAKALRRRGLKVLETREPGGSPLAERLRAVLLDKRHKSMHARAEILLFEAARVQHLAETIAPALKQGAVVLCDRFADSTTAYQGAGRALNRSAVKWLNRFACDGIWPDLTLVFDLPVAEGLRRARAAKGGADRMETARHAFHQRVRAEFLRLARREPRRVKLLRVQGMSVETVQAQVWQILLPSLRRAGHAF